MIEILDANDLGHLIYGHGWEQLDPIHRDDIEPVMTDGPVWQAGDVFLSIRNRSLVVLYRPSTDQILWSQAGPWVHQHDVDIVGPTEISVFDNRARLISTEAPSCPAWRETDPCLETSSRNHRIVVDLESGETTDTFATAFTDNAIITHKQGLQTLMDDGTLMVEETNQARLLALSEAGDVQWSFVNRAEGDGNLYTLNWSRIIPRDIGDSIRNRLSEGVCDA